MVIIATVHCNIFKGAFEQIDDQLSLTYLQEFERRYDHA